MLVVGVIMGVGLIIIGKVKPEGKLIEEGEAAVEPVSEN